MTQMEREVILILIRGLRGMANELEEILNQKGAQAQQIEVASELMELGFSNRYIGFGYLVEAIEMQTDYPAMQLKEICAEIGNKHYAPEATVHTALDALFKNLTKKDREKIWQKYRAETPKAFIRSFVYNNR